MSEPRALSPVARELLSLWLAQPDFVGSLRDFALFLNRAPAEVLAAAREVQGYGAVAVEGEPEAPAIVFRPAGDGIIRRVRAALEGPDDEGGPRSTRVSFGYSPDLIGRSPAMRPVYAMIERVSRTDATVLLLGESGTGKEVVARTIHAGSARAGQAFTVIDCTAIPSDLLESELFGHERGSFTSALRKQLGKFEEADGGTVFLDEVAELSLGLQAKLLRAIQTRQFARVGGTTPIAVDVRFIAATNRRLDEMIRARQFREDLYYRLNVVAITLPPLRERREDIPLLAQRTLSLLAQRDGTPPRMLTPAALARLAAHDWPGNVRELQNVLERALVMAPGPAIDAGELSLPAAPALGNVTALKTLRDIEVEHIERVLATTNGNEARAAQILGIHRDTLYRKLKRHRR